MNTLFKKSALAIAAAGAFLGKEVAQGTSCR